MIDIFYCDTWEDMNMVCFCHIVWCNVSTGMYALNEIDPTWGWWSYMVTHRQNKDGTRFYTTPMWQVDTFSTWCNSHTGAELGISTTNFNKLKALLADVTVQLDYSSDNSWDAVTFQDLSDYSTYGDKWNQYS